MNSRLLVCASALLVVAAFASPAQRTDNCNGVAASKLEAFNKAIGHVKADDDLGCTICLDLISLAETFVECGEGTLGDFLDHYCNKISSSFLKNLCLDLVNAVVAALENNSDPDPGKICTSILKRPCAKQ